jgi:hypothetical protein
MSSLPKRDHYYDITLTISGYSCAGGGTDCSARAFAGIEMVASTPGTWKLAAGLTRLPDRFTWGLGHGIEVGGYDLRSPPFTLTGPGNSHEGIGSWRDFCGPGPIATVDPVLNPLRPGANHAHTFIGNTIPDRENTTYTSLRTKGSSTCQSMVGDDVHYPINASAYWMPSFVVEKDGKLYYLKTNGALIYYKGPPVPAPTIDYSGITPYGAIISANGTSTITRTSGHVFNDATNFQVGKTFYVGSTAYTVVSITDADHMVLSGTVPTGTGLQLDEVSRQLKDQSAVMCNERWGRGDGGFGTGVRLDGGVATLTTDQFGNPVTDTTRCPWMPPQMVFITGYNKANGQGRTDVPIDIATGDAGTGAGGINSGSQSAFFYSIWKGPDYYPDSAEVMTPNFDTLEQVWDWIDAHPGVVSPGMALHVQTSGPTCWDGKHVDSPDHRSHIAFGVNSTADVGNQRCPPNIPYPIVEMSIQWYYTLDDAFFARKWRLSVDEMVDGLPAGAGLHTDYMEAQSPTLADKAANLCEQPHNSCTQDLGDGTKLTGPRSWDGSDQFCNGCMKHRPDRYVPVTEGGMSWDLKANGTYTIRLKAGGAPQWGVMGLKGFNGTISGLSIVEVPPPSAKGPRTVTGGGMAENDNWLLPVSFDLRKAA